MNSRAALGAAVAVALTVTGGVSALFLTVVQAADASPTGGLEPAVVEYVDQYGNPVAAPGPAPALDPEHVDPEHDEDDHDEDDAEEYRDREDADHSEDEQATAGYEHG